jgi:hypothetical protein
MTAMNKQCIITTITATAMTSIFAGCQNKTATQYENSETRVVRMHYDNTTPAMHTEYILRNLSPQMDGLAESHAEDKAGISVTNNMNDRMYTDDWRRALMVDKPSALTPLPVVQN